MSKRIGGLPTPLLIIIFLIVGILFILGLLSGPIGQGLMTRFGINIAFPSWLVVHRPEVSLPAEDVFHLFGFVVTNSLVASWVTMAVLILAAFAITRKMKIVPGRLQAGFEFALGSLYSFCESVAGDVNARKFFPVVATIFLFVLFNAWLALVPGYGSITIVNPEGVAVPLLRGPNTDFNTPLAIAFVSFVFVLYFGVKSLGIGYFRQYFNFGPLFHAIGKMFKGKFNMMDLFAGAVGVFVGALELLSMFVRIVSFTFRLFGNMTAGELLVVILAFLMPWVVGSAVYGLELLVGFVQALIFGGLTLVFLTMAAAAHGEESHHS